MKRFRRFLIITVIIALVCVTLSACKRKEEGSVDNGITVTFITGFEDEDVRVDPIVITMDEPGSLPDDPFYAGYEFTGWYYDVKCTQLFSTKDALKEDTVLYAGWEKKRTDADLNGNGGKVTDEKGLEYVFVGEDHYKVIGYTGNATELVIPDTYMGFPVTEAGQRAFGDNSVVEKITLSSAFSHIERDAFAGLKRLNTIVITGSDAYATVNGILYSKDLSVLLAVGMGRTEDLTVSDNVKEIGEYAFYSCSFDVTLPESELKVIGEYAFAYFKGDLTISETVNELRKKAFYEATGEIRFPDEFKVNKLANGEFDGYKGEKLVLPSSINEIKGSPFYGATCELDISRTGIRTLGESALAGYAGEKFVVPYFVEDVEANCFYRCTAKVTFDERTNYSLIKSLAFNQYAGEVIFPSTVNRIEENAFYAASYATIRFSSMESEIAIEENAFNLCPIDKTTKKLKNVYFK